MASVNSVKIIADSLGASHRRGSKFKCLWFHSKGKGRNSVSLSISREQRLLFLVLVLVVRS